MADEKNDSTSSTAASAAPDAIPAYNEWAKAKADSEKGDAEASVTSAPEPESGEKPPSEIKEPPKEKPQKHPLVDEMVRWRRLARREQTEKINLSTQVSELRTRLESFEKQAQTAAPRTAQEKESGLPLQPALEEYQTVKEWQKAFEQWLNQRDDIREKARAERETLTAKERQQQQTQTHIQQNWDKVSARGEELHPGFNSAIDKALRKGTISQPVANAVVMLALDDADGAIAVAHALAENPKEARRLALLEPHRVPFEVGKLLHSLASPTEHRSEAGNHKPASAATTVLNGSGKTKALRYGDPMTYDEFVTLKEREKAARR